MLDQLAYDIALHELWLRSDKADGSCLTMVQRTLANVRLSRKLLSYSDLRRCAIIGGDLSRSNLEGALLESTIFKDVNLSDASLNAASLTYARFNNVNLADASLMNTDLRGAQLVSCCLRGADLRGSDLQGANLSSADLHGALLKDSVASHLTRWPSHFKRQGLESFGVKVTGHTAPARCLYTARIMLNFSQADVGQIFHVPGRIVAQWEADWDLNREAVPAMVRRWVEAGCKPTRDELDDYHARGRECYTNCQTDYEDLSWRTYDRSNATD